MASDNTAVGENVIRIGSDTDGLTIPPFPEIDPKEALLDDWEFLRALRRLKDLSAFLSQASAVPTPVVRQAALLGGLNQLGRTLAVKGRRATFLEWTQVEQRTQTIWAALSEQQRRKFLTTQAPGWLSWVISIFVVLAAAALVIAFLVHQNKFYSLPGANLIPFLVWIISLGAIGATSSIGMNALSVQDDATFDISNGKFIWLRLVVGALFGTVLSLPFGFGPFVVFLGDLAAPSASVDATKAANQAVLLLLPFILGFSTSVVILILNRLIESMQTFFGKTPAKIG